MRSIKYIVLHCTAGPQNQSLKAIQNYWKSKGWSRPGYHHMIEADGSVHNLVPIENISNGVAGFNSNSIHISYMGGVGHQGEILDNRTDAQKAKQKELVEKYKAMFPTATILGHRDFSPDKNRNGIIEENEWMKACPSFSVKAWLKEADIIRNPVMPEVKRMVNTQSGKGVNVRMGPGITYGIVEAIPDGTPCLILVNGADWSQVQVSDNIKGWIKNNFLK